MNLDGTLSEEETLIKDSFEEYCRRRYVPKYREMITTGEFPHHIMKDIADIALPLSLPDGEGRPEEVILGILSESMGFFEFPVPAFLTLHFAKLIPLIRDEDLRNTYTRRYRSGELVICGAFTEPGYGSDSASISTSARREGNEYVLNGEKAFVSSPGIADAHIISARTAVLPSERKHQGISLFITDAENKGIETYEMENMASIFRGDFGGLRLDDVHISEGHLIGKENGGFYTLMKVLDVQCVHVALYAIGLARSAIEEAILYSKTRKTFGHPISRYQAISFRLAEDWSKLESVRALAYKALAMQERGRDNTAECADVKSLGSTVAFEAVNHALQTGVLLDTSNPQHWKENSVHPEASS